MGLIASIFKDETARKYDVSLGGISKYFNEVCIINASGPSIPSLTCPAVLIDSHVPGIVRAVPAVYDTGRWVPRVRHDASGPMMGGSYIASADSRFGELIEGLTGKTFYGAVALHDRYEKIK